MRKKVTTFDNVIRELEQMKKAPEKVIKRTLSDFRQRGPGWISTEVTKKYNIKKAEVNEGVRVKGNTVDSITIIYKGRVLAPVHFSMNPKAPKQSYTLKAMFKKGDRKTLGKVKKLTKKQKQNIGRNFTHQGKKTSRSSPIMLMSTGNKKIDGVNFIPFQRQSQKRNDLKAIKTLSVPQMVSNKKVEENIQEAVNEKLGKRFDHYVDMYFKD